MNFRDPQFLLGHMRRKSLDFRGLIPNMAEAKFLKAQYRAMIQHQRTRTWAGRVTSA